MGYTVVSTLGHHSARKHLLMFQEAYVLFLEEVN